jgi:hypothetical protein
VIPREILKKIRQIELRTNRLVSEASFQPASENGRIASAMKDGNDADKFRLNMEIHAVFVEVVQPSATNRVVNNAEPFWVFQDAIESSVDLSFESVSQSRLLLVTPSDRLIEFKPGVAFKDYFSAPARLLRGRFLSSARTLSHVIPFSGLRRSRSARFLNSASCSGVNLSSHDNRRDRSRSPVLLMGKSYARWRQRQAGTNVAPKQYGSHEKVEVRSAKDDSHFALPTSPFI